MLRYLTVLIVSMFSVLGCNSKPEDKNVRFWKWFVANKTRLYEQKENQEELFNELTAQLFMVDSNLAFEFSPIHNDGIRIHGVS